MKNKISFSGNGSFVTGVNYWASHAAIEMWSRWDETVIEHDLKVLAEHGVQMLRVFPLWPDFQPITRLYYGDGRGAEYRFGEDELPDTDAGRAGVNEVMMQRFERLCDIASKNGISVIVALLTGHMTFRMFMPQGLYGLNPVNDAEAIMWEQRYIRYFVKRMKHHPAVFAWEFGNECNINGKADSAAEASVWMCTMADVIKREDPSRLLISGMDGSAIDNAAGSSMPNSPAIWSAMSQAEHCDILSTHYYSMWRSPKSDPCDTIKAGLFPAAEAQLYRDITGKPCFIEETGLWRPMAADFETAARHLRMLYWNSLSTANGGLLWWCAFDQDNQNRAPYDWESPGVEHGMFGHDYTARPTGTEMKRFRNFVDALPYTAFPKPAADAVCILGDQRQNHQNIAAASFIMAREAGFSIGFQYSHQPLRDAPFYLLPSACGKAGFTNRRWMELKKKVFDGATLYVSSDDMYLQGLSEVTGAEVSTRSENGGETRYIIDGIDGKIELKLHSPVVHSMKTLGAAVRGYDTEQHPVFFETSYGKGKVFYLSIPLEKMMMNKACAFLAPESRDAWKIYSLMMKDRLSRKIITKHEPLLSLSEHRISDNECAIILVNNSPDEITDELPIRGGWKLKKSYSYDKREAESMSTAVRIVIGPNSGMILCLEK